jgi:hypothetical protein
MRIMLVNLCVKNPNSLVNYKLSKPFFVNNDAVRINDINFHIPTLVKEVKNSSKNKLHQYKKVIQTFLTTVGSFAIFPLRSMASELNPTQKLGQTTLPHTATGMPPELLELLLTLLKISVGAAVILAAILLVANAIGRMFRVSGMTTWAKDIIRGLVQVLIAVPLVFLIYYVANLLFSGNGWWISPF